MLREDHDWMRYAIKLAQQATLVQEVPVGAIVVAQNEIIGSGYNQPISTNDPTAHAEIVALRQAAAKMNNYRLVDTTMYVTLEPCVMCVGALMHARVKRLVFGAFDKKRGAVQSQCQLHDLPSNHKLEYGGGILEEECVGLLQSFFQERR